MLYILCIMITFTTTPPTVKKQNNIYDAYHITLSLRMYFIIKMVYL